MGLEPLQFETTEEMLDGLAARSRGRYFICKCPKCNKHEAFIYKNNLNYIVCNRQNNCGFSAKIEYQKEQAISKSYQRVSTMTKEKQAQLEIFSKYIHYLQKYVQEDNLPDFRGLSRTTVNPFILDVQNEPFVKHLYTRFNKLFKPEYANVSHMTKRNILIPIFNDEQMIDRLLLRSSIDSNISKKEIQILFNDGENSIDHFSDYDEETKVIVIAESVLDGLSFREIDKSVGVMGLIGNKVIGQVVQKLQRDTEFFQDKHFLLALDNDKAGKETERKLKEELEQLNLSYSIFPYPEQEKEQFKDPNQFLQENRRAFESVYEEHLRSNGIQVNLEIVDTWEQLLEKVGIKYEEVEVSNIEEIFPQDESIQEELDYKMREEINKMNMKIKSMSLLKDDKDQERGVASVQYGDLTLNNLSVREVNGVPMVFTPTVKNNDEYFDVYSFNDKPPYNFDKRVIEGALIKGYYELKHGITDKIKDMEISFTSQANSNENKITPRILNSMQFDDGNKAMNVGYKNVVVNNIVIRKVEGDKQFVSMPFYKNKKQEFKKHVIASKELSEEILNLSNGENRKNQSPKKNKGQSNELER